MTRRGRPTNEELARRRLHAEVAAYLGTRRRKNAPMWESPDYTIGRQRFWAAAKMWLNDNKGMLNGNQRSRSNRLP